MAKAPVIKGTAVLSNGALAVLAGNYNSYTDQLDQLQVAILSNTTPVTLNQTSGLSFANAADTTAGAGAGSGGSIAALPAGGMAVLTWGDPTAHPGTHYDLQILNNAGTVTTAPLVVATNSGGDMGAVGAWSGGLVVAYKTSAATLTLQRYTLAGALSGSAVTVPNGANWGSFLGNASMAVDAQGDVIFGFVPTSVNAAGTYEMFNAANTMVGSGATVATNIEPIFAPVNGGGFVAINYTGHTLLGDGNYSNFDLNVQVVSTAGAISTKATAANANAAGDSDVSAAWDADFTSVTSSGLVVFQEADDAGTAFGSSFNIGTSTLTRHTVALPAPYFAFGATNPSFDVVPSATSTENNIVGVGVNTSNQLVEAGVILILPPTVTESLVSDTGASNSDKITSGAALTGTGDANAVVTLTEGASTLGTATANAGGTWSFTPSLSNGSHTIVASGTNGGGTGSASLTFTLDTVAPVVTESLKTDTGASSSDKTTSNAALTGGGDANTVVTLKEGTSTLGTTTANASGTWSFTPTLSDGAHTVVASETDLAGNAGSATLTFTLDTVAPVVTEALSSDTGASSSDKNTSNAALTGGGDANAIVTLTEGASTLGTTTANAGGTWSFTPSLTNGAHTIVASETDLAGNSGSASLTFTLDTVAPVVTESLSSDTGASSSDKNTSNAALTGGGDANAVVTLKEGVSTLGTTTANGAGTWSFTPSLADGAHTTVASETDLAGNTGSATLTLTLDTVAPVVTESLSSDTGASSVDKNTSNPALTGTGDANAVVTLKEGASTLGTTTANGAGSWSFTPTLSDGVHTVVASETDLAGNAGAAAIGLTLDTTAPAVTESLVTPGNPTSSSAVTGGGDPNAVVTLKEGASTLGTTTANGSGSWSFTPVLADGAHTIVASETDTAGNTGSASLTFTLATKAPPVTESLVSDTGSSASDKITSNPALTGGGDPNAVVTLTEGASTLGTTTANGSGTWSFTPTLSDGTHTIVASETTAGNTGTASLTFTLDTAAPSVTESLVSDTGASSSDKNTSNAALTGGGDANAIVTLKEGASTLGTTTANAGGTWSFTPSLTNGGHTIVASETDTAGNSGSATLAFTLDTVAPIVSESLVSDTGASSDKITSNPAVTGGGDANAIVTLTEGASTLGTTTANGSGTWSFTPSLSDGVHTVAASETDTAGNTGSAILGFTLDTAAPAVSESLVSDTGASASDKITSNDALTGGGDANAIVTLKEGVSTLGTTTANGSGAWSFTPTLSDGTHTVVASETDLAGNTGSATLAFTLDTIAPAVTENLTSGTSPTADPTVNGGGDANAVVILTEGASTLGTTTANGAGSWSFTPSLPDGPHTIVASEMDIAGNAGSASVTFTLSTSPTTATFNAHVYTDVNGDGVEDAGDTNLSGVTVNLLDGSGNPTGQSLTTNAGGNVSFTGLAPGSYEIAVVPPAGDVVSEATNTFTPNVLGAGGTASAKEGVYAPATFSVHVYTDANVDNTEDAGDSFLSGVTVNLLDGSGNPTGKSTTTNASGDASFTGLPPGKYEIQVVTPTNDAVTEATNTLTPNTLSSGGSASAKEGVYLPPALIASSLSLTVAEGLTLGNIWSQIIANGIDPNPASLKVTSVGTGGTHGAVLLSTPGANLTYIASGLDPSNPVDTFTYTLTDDQARSVVGTVAVTITGPTLPTTVVTTPGSSTTVPGPNQRIISEGPGQTLFGDPGGGDLFFGGGDTNIVAKGSGNTIYVTPGNHSIVMGANNNTATLYDGNNIVSATGTGNTVTAGNGNNTISGMTGSATIVLGNGNNGVTISGANNKVTVGNGKNTLSVGNGGNESVTAGDGANTISGGGANDTFLVGNGANKVTAIGANATITAGGGGDNVLVTGAGARITTGAGNDTIQVTAGTAIIKAGLGTNSIKFAGSGNQIINQGGTDTLTDTGTNNTIAVPLAGQGLDTITGSVLSNGDTFDLRAAMAATTWDQQMSDIGAYLTLGTSGSNALVQLSVTAGGTPITVAVLNGAGSVSLSTFLTHSQLT